MARKTKNEMARELIEAGWFWQYKGNVDKLVKETTWEQLHDQYIEMKDFRKNVKE